METSRRKFRRSRTAVRKAAKQGHPKAQRYLAACYANGSGVAQNHGEAIKWYRMAAVNGDADAQCTLGRCLALGNHVTAECD